MVTIEVWMLSDTMLWDEVCAANEARNDSTLTSGERAHAERVHDSCIAEWIARMCK